ncbi:peroxiredoxin-like family protein [Methylocapsa sp. S129]|uniref:peroxiredoxin-like family protein n=1 Tax=Methylocapsa sp. S129 TaxID=1641869 RepID=UPI00131BFB6B|nr:peroxiredoxin-like family protein [Methylocapsa sp. S129]
MSLQDRLDAFKTEFLKKVPPEAAGIMDKATAALVASGQAKQALGVGGEAPKFNLPSADGAVVASSDLLAKGPLVVVFYRGAWCPYCNLDLKAIEETASDIRALGASLIAISPQTAPNSRKMQEQNGLSFPILSDQGGAIAEAFGLRFRLPDDLVKLMTGFGVDLAMYNDDPNGTLPMPARYVIDKNGIVAYAEVSPDYTRRPDPSELLPTLRRLRELAAA